MRDRERDARVVQLEQQLKAARDEVVKVTAAAHFPLRRPGQWQKDRMLKLGLDPES